jgi:uridine phosphorylase
MMDFFVREARAIVEGPMAIVRFGTCGGISDQSAAGTIVVAEEGSAYVSRNYDYFPFRSTSEKEPYIFYQVFD